MQKYYLVTSMTVEIRVDNFSFLSEMHMGYGYIQEQYWDDEMQDKVEKNPTTLIKSDIFNFKYKNKNKNKSHCWRFLANFW